MLKDFPLKKEPTDTCPQQSGEEKRNPKRQGKNGIRVKDGNLNTANHFASYLGFVPHNKITGGRIISSRTDRINSPASQAFKKIIPSISQRDTVLGAFYRRIVYRVGTGKAVVATCRKLAIAFYYAITEGKEYIDEGRDRYIKRQEERERNALIRLAKKYNMQLNTAS